MDQIEPLNYTLKCFADNHQEILLSVCVCVCGADLDEQVVVAPTGATKNNNPLESSR